MDNFVYFQPWDLRLSGYVRLSFTASAYQRFREIVPQGMDFLREFSATGTMVCRIDNKDGEEFLCITTSQCVFRCAKVKDGLLIRSTQPLDLHRQSVAMRQSICVRLDRGLIIKLRLTDYNLFFDFVQGKTAYNNTFDNISTVDAVEQIYAAICQNVQAPPPESVTLSRQLDATLRIAESYAELEYALDVEKAEALGEQYYVSKKPIEYDRKDQVAYQFRMRALPEEFQKDTWVEIRDKTDQVHSARIDSRVEDTEDAQYTYLTLVFMEQLSDNDFYSEGYLAIKPSAVNRNVQLRAIEKLRNGTATAKFMDAVIGSEQPGAFTQIPLEALEMQLKSQERPPNDSQLEAIKKGIRSQDLLLVMGPPGTGKTTVILEWVRYFVLQEHKRVLISSQSNFAVDNVLVRLAQEKQVDMIRLASNSSAGKLQSAILPYIFEKKVESQREKLMKDTTGHRQVIRQTLTHWQAYEKLLQEAVQIDAQAKSLLTQFRQAVWQRLRPLYDFLVQQLQEHRQLAEQMHKLAAVLTRLEQKLRYHENAAGLLRFFTGLLVPLRQRKLRAKWQALQQLREEETLLLQAYHANYVRYKEQEQSLKTQFYDPWLAVQQQLNTALVRLQHKPVRLEGDIWDLYGIARSMPVRAPEDLPGQVQQLRQAAERAASLDATLQLWQEDMGDKQNYALGDIIMESVDLVGATCIGISSQRRFPDMTFDVAIVDEAGQIQLHNALVPMSVAKKVILLGDHKQIPPHVDRKLKEKCQDETVAVDTSWLDMSLFEKLYNKKNVSRCALDLQYRCPKQLADVISQDFYEGNYLSHSSRENMPGLLPALSKLPVVFVDIGDLPEHYSEPVGTSCRNKKEAEVVAAIARYCLQTLGMKPEQLGVITPYKPQVEAIEKGLTDLLPPRVMGDVVASLDSFQGQERDVILYSFTRSGKLAATQRRLGFMHELRRLNVAVTRTKGTLVMVGDLEYWSTCQYQDQENDEKRVSDFICDLLALTDQGLAERISGRQCLERLKGGAD